MKIPRGEGSEDTCISKDRQYNSQKKQEKGQTIANKTLHRKLKFEQCEHTKNMRLKSGVPKRQELPAPLLTAIVLRSIARLTSCDIGMNTNNTNLTLTFLKQIKEKKNRTSFHVDIVENLKDMCKVNIIT